MSPQWESESERRHHDSETLAGVQSRSRPESWQRARSQSRSRSRSGARVRVGIGVGDGATTTSQPWLSRSGRLRIPAGPQGSHSKNKNASDLGHYFWEEALFHEREQSKSKMFYPQPPKGERTLSAPLVDAVRHLGPCPQNASKWHKINIFLNILRKQSNFYLEKFCLF